MDNEVPVQNNVVEPQPAEQPAPGPAVAAIQIKLPLFWPKDPALWFTKSRANLLPVESRCPGPSSTMVSSLLPEFATEVRDLLLNPPREQPYKVLKRELTNRTSLSKQRQLQQLPTAEELGNRKPTQVLHRIQQLLGDKAHTLDGSFMLELFCNACRVMSTWWSLHWQEPWI